MKKFKSIMQRSNFQLLSVLAAFSLFTAHMGASAASTWTFHQPELPEELRR